MAYPYYGNTYQPYNPYSNYMPTGPQNAAGAQQVFNGQIIRVNGKNGADALRLAPNSSDGLAGGCQQFRGAREEIGGLDQWQIR